MKNCKMKVYKNLRHVAALKRAATWRETRASAGHLTRTAGSCAGRWKRLLCGASATAAAGHRKVHFVTLLYQQDIASAVVGTTLLVLLLLCTTSTTTR